MICSDNANSLIKYSPYPANTAMNTAANRMIHQTVETREKILAGAQQLFVENGYAETQMKDIAAAIGISRHTLYRYYRDKSDLGFAVQTKIYTDLEPAIRSTIAAIAEHESLNSRQVLVRVVLALFSLPSHELDFRFLAEFDSYNSGARLTKNTLDRFPVLETKQHSKYLYDIARRGVKEGSIRNDKPIEELARTTGYAVQALAYRLLTRGEALHGVSESERGRMLSNLAELLEDGLRPR